MNERIKLLAEQAGATQGSYIHDQAQLQPDGTYQWDWNYHLDTSKIDLEKFAELVVKEMCELMEQAEDDAYHCVEPSERPTEHIDLLRAWQKQFEKHFEKVQPSQKLYGGWKSWNEK